MKIKTQMNTDGICIKVNDNLSTKYYDSESALYEQLDDGLPLFQGTQQLATLKLSHVGQFQIEYL